jgi:hypothetical protein
MICPIWESLNRFIANQIISGELRSGKKGAEMEMQNRELFY